MTQKGVPIEVGLADLQVSIARTMAVICRQLIERRLLDEEILIADLAQLRGYLRRDGLTAPLAGVLKQPPDRQP